LPRVAEITPATFACERLRPSMVTRPPRTLKAHVGVWFSCFTHTSHPIRRARRGHAYCGVGGTTRRTDWAAASNSASVKSGSGALMKDLRARRKGSLAQLPWRRFHVLDP